jgi:hypothetical protein
VRTDRPHAERRGSRTHGSRRPRRASRLRVIARSVASSIARHDSREAAGRNEGEACAETWWFAHAWEQGPRRASRLRSIARSAASSIARHDSREAAGRNEGEACAETWWFAHAWEQGPRRASRLRVIARSPCSRLPSVLPGAFAAASSRTATLTCSVTVLASVTHPRAWPRAPRLARSSQRVRAERPHAGRRGSRQ